MRSNRYCSIVVVATPVVAGLLIAATLAPPPKRHPSAQAASQSSGTKRTSAPQPPTGFKTPLAEQRLVGGYWRTDHTFQPTLIITNLLQQIELPVAPVLYAADGTEYPLPAVTLSPAGVASIDIRAALSGAPEEIRAHFQDFGSVAVKYMWHWANAATALVENRDVPRSLIFNFELRPLMNPTARMAAHHGASETVKERLCWKEDSGVKGFIAFVNVAQRTVNARVQILSDYGALETESTIHLQTNEARKLEFLDGTGGSSGGIRVTYDGGEGDVLLAGGLENPQEGYSAQIPFLTVAPQTKPSSVDRSSVGLMLGAPDPMMKFPSGTKFGVYLALRNTTSQSILVSPTLYYTQGSEVVKSALKTLPLAAGQARHWTPDELFAELGLPKLDGIINLVFSYQGSRSDLIMASGSIDQTKTYVFEIKMEGVGRSLGKGLKDWDVSNGNDTMISLVNLDEKDQDLAVTFFFDGGHYKLPVHLKAGESTMFNVSDIIVRQQPDADGNNIQPGKLHGTAMLAAASPDPQWFNVGVSIGVFNVSTATCAGRCPNCSNYSDYEVLPYNSDLSSAPVGGTATFVAWGFAQDGLWHNVTYLTSWSSDNDSVATPSGGGSFSGVSAGYFIAYADTSLEYGNGDCVEGNTPCPTQPWFGYGSGTIVSAVISQNISGSVSGDDGAQGRYLDLLGTTNLGMLISGGSQPGCLAGFETVGTVSPSTYKGNVVIHRVVVNQGRYVNSTDLGGERTNSDDTSPSSNRDDDPQSGNPSSAGKVYDIDAPGVNPGVVDGNTYRYRSNFYTYASLPDGRQVSPNYSFYVRLSCTTTSSGNQFVNDVSGDNRIGSGTTATSWNLQ